MYEATVAVDWNATGIWKLDISFFFFLNKNDLPLFGKLCAKEPLS